MIASSVLFLTHSEHKMKFKITFQFDDVTTEDQGRKIETNFFNHFISHSKFDEPGCSRGDCVTRLLIVMLYHIEKI